MTFKNVSNSDLITSTWNAIAVETSATTNVVRHFREIHDRELHLSSGFSSMFLMATKEFGYDRASAQRRVNAMELSLAVPSLLERIDAGELCLQSAADIQTFLNRERAEKKPYSVDQKRELVEVCSGLSTREVQIELAKRNPTLDFRESKKFVSADLLQITYTSAVKTEDKLERIRNILSHSRPYMNRIELIDYMAERTLDAIDPVRKLERAEKRLAAKAIKASKAARVLLVPAQELRKVETGAESVTEEPKVDGDAAGEEVAFEEVVSEAGEIQLVASFAARSRYVKAAEDRKVRRKNGGRGCDYVDPETGRRCGSMHQLQRDHIVLYSHGGGNESENLRLYCAQHNRFRWRRRSTVRSDELDYVS